MVSAMVAGSRPTTRTLLWSESLVALRIEALCEFGDVVKILEEWESAQ
jgi:hypothetical protein